MSVQKLKNRIYVETAYEGANVSSVDTAMGQVLIDTPLMLEDVKQWKQELDRLSGKDIAYIINSDYHFDHCLGSSFLSPNVVAHQSTYETMIQPDGTMREFFLTLMPDMPEEVKQEIRNRPLALPKFTFNDSMWLHLGDANFQLIYVGGHTASTIITYLIEDKVLFSGDCVECNQHPYKGQANFRQWIEALLKVRELDIDLIVPGHGEVCDKSELFRMIDYFQHMWDEVSSLHKEGYARDEVVRRVHHLLDFYPPEPGMETRTAMMFDEGTVRMYDEIANG